MMSFCFFYVLVFCGDCRFWWWLTESRLGIVYCKGSLRCGCHGRELGFRYRGSPGLEAIKDLVLPPLSAKQRCIRVQIVSSYGELRLLNLGFGGTRFLVAFGLFKGDDYSEVHVLDDLLILLKMEC
ncbi:hypothetical protein HPP92_001463 [Vanilla planifolia]|uniref:Uncharacterized protein n=1 Tax=Vanilla planifolia TaxID=51239 RepID=A0A835S4A0_VANPL|nr:hypothetical protein HPP92_001463 [Vanilla planifolia]